MSLVSKKSGSFDSFDGTRIYYEERGEGEPLVLVYGLACLMNHWHHQIQYFARTHRVITFDLRGHHQSATPEDKKALCIEAMAKDLKLLLDRLDIPAAHFAGHSNGVSILVRLAALHPQRVLSLTLVNGFVTNPIRNMFGLDVVEPFFYLVKENYRKAPAIFDRLWKFCVENPLSMFLSGIAGGFNLNVTEIKDVEIYARGVAQLPFPSFLALFEDVMAFDGREDARKILAPTLIISGEKDAVTPFAQQQKLQQLIPGSELTVVPYGSHCCQLDFPDYVNLKIENHLRHSAKRLTGA